MEAPDSDADLIPIAPPDDATPSIQTCRNCNVELVAGARLCTNCGLDLQTGEIHEIADVRESEGAEARLSISTIATALSGRKRWIGVVVLAFVGLGSLTWYTYDRLAHPAAGPYDVTFRPRGDGLEMSIFWHSLILPSEPTRNRDITNAEVDGWYVFLPDGTRLEPRWTETNYKFAVNVLFSVPKSVTIRLGKHTTAKHEAELVTPDGEAEVQVLMKWCERTGR